MSDRLWFESLKFTTRRRRIVGFRFVLCEPVPVLCTCCVGRESEGDTGFERVTRAIYLAFRALESRAHKHWSALKSERDGQTSLLVSNVRRQHFSRGSEDNATYSKVRSTTRYCNLAVAGVHSRLNPCCQWKMEQFQKRLIMMASNNISTFSMEEYLTIMRETLTIAMGEEGISKYIADHVSDLFHLDALERIRTASAVDIVLNEMRQYPYDYSICYDGAEALDTIFEMN